MEKRITIILALLAMLALLTGALAEGLIPESELAGEGGVFSDTVDAPVGEEEQWIGSFELPVEDVEAEVKAGEESKVTVVGKSGTLERTKPVVYHYKGALEVAPGITVIGYRAFDIYANDYYYHSNPDVTSVHIPDSVIRLEEQAFADVGTKEGLTVNLPESINYIGKSAFLGSGLKAVTLPASVVFIEESTFRNCALLTSVTLKGTLAKIGVDAFKGCKALPEITIPDGVAFIGESAFEGCTALTTVKLPANLIEISKATFKGDTLLTNIALPNSLTGIGESAFEKCYSLRSVAVPEGVTAISRYAFQDCQILTSAILPAGLETIENFAFYNCTQLNSVNGAGSVEIPDGVTKIGCCAFAKDISITKLVIGEEIEIIDEDAFNGCSLLKDVTIKGHGEVKKGAFNNIHPSAKFTISCNLKLADDLESKGYTVEKTHGAIVEDAAVPSTCTETGKTAGSHCADCGKVIEPQGVVSALGHRAVKDPAVAATFKKTGLTEGKHCSVCGKVLVEQQVVPKLSGSVNLDKTGTQTLVIDKSLQLKATTNPSTYKSNLTWKSSKPKVASVSNKGKVKALAKGTTVITAKLPDGSGASVTVKVEAPKPTGIKLMRDGKKVTKYTLKAGKYVVVNATLSPKKAEGKLIWSSSNTDVATVNDAEGYNTVVSIRAHKAGKATITVTAENNPKAKATIKITVKKK